MVSVALQRNVLCVDESHANGRLSHLRRHQKNKLMAIIVRHTAITAAVSSLRLSKETGSESLIESTLEAYTNVPT